MSKSLQTPPGYADLLAEIKTRVRTAQVRAAFAVSRELILLYWSIGRDILNRQRSEGWGTKVIERLAKDLGTEFPGVEGFSPRSLKYMRQFAGEWPDESIVQQLAAQLPWGHHMVLLDRIKDGSTREWYLRAAIEYGWSRNILVHQISGRLHEREGKALTNFRKTLPSSGRIDSASPVEFPSSLLFALRKHPHIDIDGNPAIFPRLCPFFFRRNTICPRLLSRIAELAQVFSKWSSLPSASAFL